MNDLLTVDIESCTPHLPTLQLGTPHTSPHPLDEACP